MIKATIAYKKFDQSINTNERQHQTAQEIVITDPIGDELWDQLPHRKDDYNYCNYYPYGEQRPSVGAPDRPSMRRSASVLWASSRIVIAWRPVSARRSDQ